jgi:hypothetical protein
VLVASLLNIPASNNRDWQPEAPVTPYATISGDLMTIHGVRNLDYRTEIDFDARWENRTSANCRSWQRRSFQSQVRSLDSDAQIKRLRSCTVDQTGIHKNLEMAVE